MIQNWVGIEMMSLETVANVVNEEKISFFDQITGILEYLNALSSHPHLDISDEFLTKCILLNVVSSLDLMINYMIWEEWTANKYTALSDVVMFKSITLKYEDALAMVLLTRMDSSILHKFSNDVMNAIRLWCRGFFSW